MHWIFIQMEVMTLALLGNTCDLSEEVFDSIQQFICQLYNPSKKDVNEAQYEKF